MLQEPCADSSQTRMQVVNPSPTAMYTGISNAMVTISRVEGFRTLWRGLSSVVMGAGLFRGDQGHGPMRLTRWQGPRTPSTLCPTKRQSMPSAETREAARSITRSRPVRRSPFHGVETYH